MNSDPIKVAQIGMLSAFIVGTIAICFVLLDQEPMYEKVRRFNMSVSPDPQVRLQLAREEAGLERQNEQMTRAKFMKEMQRKQQMLREMRGKVMRPATKEDYEKWLRGYMMRGGDIEHVLNYPFSEYGSFWVATEDVELPGFYGALSFRLIVPAGVEVTGDRGHCALFHMDSYTTEGGMGALLFSDVNLE